ncbi:hypothetical protein [Nocardia rhamnosiphila]
MGIFGFTWADGGAFVGGALGAAILGPPGAMIGSAAGSFAGAAWGDDKGSGAALEEALVAGIGAAGGAWATDLAGTLLKTGIASAATRVLSAGGARRVDRIAIKALLPWNSHGGGPVAALGGAFGGYEVSTQARLPVQLTTTEIGNGGCPAQLPNLRMPVELTGPVGAMYRELPGYLCEVWRSFGTGPRTTPPAPELPTALPAGAVATIGAYTAKARQLNTVLAGFAELDARAVESVAAGAQRISGEGRVAVGTLIDTVNRRAAEAPPSGVSLPVHVLDLLDEAFGRGREILSQAVTSSDRVAGRVRELADEVESLRREIASPRRELGEEFRLRQPVPPTTPALPPTTIPDPAPAPPSAPPMAPAAIPPPPHTGMRVAGSGAGMGPVRTARQHGSVDAGAEMPDSRPPLSGSGGTGVPVVQSAAAASPWPRRSGPGGGASEPSSGERLPSAGGSLPHPIPVRTVPFYLPVAWPGATGTATPIPGGPASSGSGGQPGSAPAGLPAPAPGRTPWTGGTTAAPVPGCAGSWGSSHPFPVRTTYADNRRHEPRIAEPEERPVAARDELVAALHQPESGPVWSGTGEASSR